MRHGIAHATGQTGYQERSRAAGAASSTNRSVNPSIVYLKSQAPGSGTLQAADDVDPRSQSEQFVKRVAGPAELAWSQQRMNEYQKRREVTTRYSGKLDGTQGRLVGCLKINPSNSATKPFELSKNPN